MKPGQLRETVKVGKRRLALRDCSAQDLRSAYAALSRDGRRMVRRDAPARKYSKRVRQALLYSALADELERTRLPRVALLPSARLERALNVID